jgi:hypothetical protein
MNHKYDLTNKKFGRLTVISHHHKDEDRRTHFWYCQCDCGNTTIVSTSSLKRKSRPTISCGCYRYDKVSGVPAPNRLDYGLSNLRSLMHAYKKESKKKDIEFNIPEEIFYSLTQQNCHYCGVEPRQIHSKRETYGAFIYNGLDRIDSDLDYTVDNVVTCCKVCNYAKRVMSQMEFFNWIKRVYVHSINLQRRKS